jgi:hypothetical protein
VKRRLLVLTALVCGLLGVGAGAAQAQQVGADHAVCIMFLGSDPKAPGQEGICVGWTDPRL